MKRHVALPIVIFMLSILYLGCNQNTVNPDIYDKDIEFWESFHDNKFFSENFLTSFNPAIEAHLGSEEIFTSVVDALSGTDLVYHVKEHFREHKGRRYWIQDRMGYIGWDRASVHNHANGSYGFFPIGTITGQRVEGVLIANYNASKRQLRLKLIRRSRITELPLKKSLNVDRGSIRKLTFEMAASLFL